MAEDDDARIAELEEHSRALNTLIKEAQRIRREIDANLMNLRSAGDHAHSTHPHNAERRRKARKS